MKDEAEAKRIEEAAKRTVAAGRCWEGTNEEKRELMKRLQAEEMMAISKRIRCAPNNDLSTSVMMMLRYQGVHHQRRRHLFGSSCHLKKLLPLAVTTAVTTPDDSDSDDDDSDSDDDDSDSN